MNIRIIKRLLSITFVFAFFLGVASSAWALTPTEVAKLLATDGATYDRFGFSVSVHGDTAVVGAYYDDNDNGDDSGSAYVYVRDGSGNWVQQAKLLAADGATGDFFGISVSVHGDTAVIGAYYDDNDNGYDSGSAYVFSLVPTDADGDGVANDSDLCADTPLDEIVDPDTGCSIAQLCPCDGPWGTNVSWYSHGKYVSCVAKTSGSFLDTGLITEAEKDAIVSEAAESTCDH